MNDAEYILFKKKQRFWPAKILSRVYASRTRQAHQDVATCFLVEILGLNKQASVRCEVVEVLTRESVERIAAKLVGQSRKGCDSVEEITYRRALREALDILDQATSSKGRSPSKTTRSKAAKETKKRSPSMREAGHWLPSSRNGTRKREGKADKASAAPQTVDARSQRSLSSGGKAEGSSSAKSPGSKSGVLLRNRKLKGQSQRASKAKTPVTPKKDVTLKLRSGPGASSRSPGFSEGYERHHQDKASRVRSSPSSASKSFARTSTPTRSSHSFGKSTPGKEPGGKPGLRRSLLGSPVKCPSAEAEKDLSEKEFLPRKYSKDLDGQRQRQDSKGPGQKQTSGVSPLCWGRRCVSHHEDSAGSPDPVGPVLDGIQEESPCRLADEAKDFQLHHLEGKAGLGSPSEPALSPIRELCLISAFGDEEEAEDEELPSIFLHQEPHSMEAGMLVWCKLHRYPYWPAVVKSVKRKAKKASVQFIEKRMDDKKSRGFFISLRNLKHFDCEEKQMLIDKARECYQEEINWCINLITDYRIRVGCHSFTGTFLEYCADDMSYPVRKETHYNTRETYHIPGECPGIGILLDTFPQKEEGVSKEPPPAATPPKPPKKVLPDRTRAARDKANKKLVEFIVKAKGADEHLRAILKSKKQSRWLKKFLHAPPYLTSIETYLEDDNQLDLVVKYLQEVYREADAELLPLTNGDSLKFILDVLFPEAIICAISAVDQIDYKKAEEKYIRGPLLGPREREIFEEELLEKKRKQCLERLPPSPEESS